MNRSLLTYALDQNDCLVNIDEVSNGLDCKCACPYCKEPLMAKNGGTKRIHHFAHASGKECNCAYESMLHLLAKSRIRDAFLSKDSFQMQFVYKSHCSKEKSCGFVRYDECFKSSIKRFDLKKYYDSCEPEIPYDNIRRRSDLKIFSSSNPSLPPIYIEFFVTHASDEEKLHKGGKIIEVKIESEQDINRIAEEGFIEKAYTSIKDAEGINIQSPTISFWRFKNEDETASISQEIEFSRYILYPSGKSQCYQDVALCTNLVKARKNSLLEICFHTPVAFGIYEMAKYQGYRCFHINNCILCKNYVESYNGAGMICRMYKFLGISLWEPMDTAKAKDCKYFTLDQNEMNMELKKYDSLSPNEYSEIK